MRTHRTTHLLPLVALLAGVPGLAGCELAIGSWKAEQREAWTRDYTVDANGRFELINTNGRINVNPSTDGRLHVRAEKISRGASDQAAKEGLKDIEIVEKVDGGVVRLETKLPSGGLFGRQLQVEYTVQVPATVAVRVENTNGRIALADLEGAVDAETTNGGVEGRGLRGPVKADTTNGGVDLDLAEVADSGVEVSTTNGGVVVKLPASAKADLSASCTNGGINASGLDLETIESSRRKLEARLNGGGPRVRAETTNGGIRITAR